MIKRMSFVLFMALIVITTSCKKLDASSISTHTSNNDTSSNTTVIKEKGISNETKVKLAPPVDGKYPVIEFISKVHNFGKINQGDKVSFNFKFKNVGEADLLISEARATCGCTVPDYPKTAIKSGESGIIKVSFNSERKIGPTEKSIYIACNTKEGNVELKINADIKVPLVSKKQ